MITLIAAVSKDWSVGDGNKMLWHIPSEMALFKRRTIDNIVVMGRRTFESLGSKRLPNRTNIVISNSFVPMQQAKDLIDYASNENNKHVFIIGGASIWAEFIPIANNAYITHVDSDITGDTKFPKDEFLTRYEPYHETIHLYNTEPMYKVVEYINLAHKDYISVR